MRLSLIKLYMAICILLYGIICGCTCKHVESAAQRNIDVLLDSHKKTDCLRLSTVFDSLTTVCLDFPDSIILAHISAIKLINNKLYLLDRGQNGILVFAESGEFVRLFQKVGHAKDEYIFIQAFDVNPYTDEISVYDSPARRMKRYDSEGHLISETIMDDVVRDFAVLPGGDYLFYTPDEMKENRRGLWKTDSLCQFKEQLVEIPNDYLMEGVYPSYFNRVNDSTIGIMCGEYSDRIYHITDNSFEIACQINVDRKIPKWLRRQENVDFGVYKDKLYTKNSYMETPGLLQFCVTDTEKTYWIFCDKDTNETWQVQPSDIVDGDDYIIVAHSNDLIVGYAGTLEGKITLPIYTVAKK